jgi:1-acyl-sn-glycerol-3-phosphate acyltransferase
MEIVKFIRKLAVYTVIAMTALICYVPCKVINTMPYVYGAEQAEIYCNQVFFCILSNMMRLLFWIKIDYKGSRISGQNVIICNHISYFDPFVIGCVNYRYIDKYWRTKFVAYHKVLEIRIVGYVLKSIGTIPVVIHDSQMEEDNQYDKESSKNALQKAEEALVGSYSVFIFPEGKRNKDPNKLNKIKYGPFNLSKKTGRKIQVLSMVGVDKIWPAKGEPDGAGTITVTKCNEPLMFNTSEEYRERVEKMMLDGMSEPSS